jgi:hypothetical protein
MRKATATYRAPEGDNKVVEFGGVTFFDGQEVELNSDDHDHMINKLQGNQHFDIDVGEDEPSKRGPGRPKKVDLKASMDEARDHDFEADLRAKLADMIDRDNKAANDEVKN